ncbi:hypothetical protein ACJMK2_035075 [Sinanodonta woodiana]|uniref:CUB domain-containing protein n=1 Tax=Sinanodonta woodiana TaxID=1069815 RepID=A0ABD3WVT7_SINWO
MLRCRFIKVIVLIIETVCVTVIRTEGQFSKCFPKNGEVKTRLVCPDGEVIYNPKILVGVSLNRGCNYRHGDCLGSTISLERQVMACHWKRDCIIRISANDNMIQSLDSNANCTSVSPDYFLLRQPYCIPRGMVIDVCKSSPSTIRTNSGVLCSHSQYPYKINPKSRSCSTTIPIALSHTLMMSFEDVQKDSLRFINVWTSLNGTERLLDISKLKTVNFTKRETDKIRIHVNYPSTDTKVAGFIIPFSAYQTDSVQELMKWPKTSIPMIREFGWIKQNRIFDVCGSNETLISGWGVIRSHPSYPWHFSDTIWRCQRNIKIGKNKSLLLRIQDINLDPEQRDKLRLVHVVNGKKTLVADTKNIAEYEQFVIREGYVKIRFTPSRKTKAGRGFIIVFRRFESNAEDYRALTTKRKNTNNLTIDKRAIWQCSLREAYIIWKMHIKNGTRYVEFSTNSCTNSCISTTHHEFLIQ